MTAMPSGCHTSRFPATRLEPVGRGEAGGPGGLRGGHPLVERLDFGVLALGCRAGIPVFTQTPAWTRKMLRVGKEGGVSEGPRLARVLIPVAAGEARDRMVGAGAFDTTACPP